MEDFDQILFRATSAIDEPYIHFPLAAPQPRTIFRERVYCYELYHQLRMLWPEGTPFMLNGEVDKSGHPHRRMAGLNVSPDLLIHQPGDMAGNHIVLEVKSAAGRLAGIRKDLTTLRALRDRAGYHRCLLLIFGQQGAPNARALDHAFRLIEPQEQGIEIWHHAGTHAGAVRLR